MRLRFFSRRRGLGVQALAACRAASAVKFIPLQSLFQVLRERPWWVFSVVMATDAPLLVGPDLLALRRH